jgi:hypothetical protein
LSSNIVVIIVRIGYPQKKIEICPIKKNSTVFKQKMEQVQSSTIIQSRYRGHLTRTKFLDVLTKYLTLRKYLLDDKHGHHDEGGLNIGGKIGGG